MKIQKIIVIMFESFSCSSHPDDKRRFAKIIAGEPGEFACHQKGFQPTISDSQGQVYVSSKIIGWFILLLRMAILPNSNENKHFPCTFYDSKNQFLQFVPMRSKIQYSPPCNITRHESLACHEDPFPLSLMN